MIDEELRNRLAAFLREPRTMAAMCFEFKITRPTAVLWVALLAAEPGFSLEVGDTREGKAGPRSKTWKVWRTNE